MPWASRHPSEVSKAVWDGWLNSPHPVSPYLNPLWAQFWEKRWNGARAELWHHGDPAPASLAMMGVRRRRGIWDRFHVLPFGTTGGFLGSIPAGETLANLTLPLWRAVAGPRTVELTLNLLPSVSPNLNWKLTEIISPHWVLEISSPGADSPDASFSESHRRNIRKGEDLGATLSSVRSRDDACDLITSWSAPETHPSRMVLDAGAGPLLADLFQGNQAMVWRVVSMSDRPLATCLWLVNGPVAVYLDGAVSKEKDATGINHFLFDRVLAELRSRGATTFDFGAGPAGVTSEGLAQFKAGWGARPVEHRELILRRPWYHAARKLM